MSKILVLAEKPSVGRELARVLGADKKGNGCYRGSRYIVTWALGHLVSLAQPEHYGSQWKQWSFETLPMLPQPMELTVLPETSKQYRVVKELLHDKEVASVIIATDAGREGELVARWILQKSGVKKPLQRLWISSQTDKAIKEGFSHLKNGKEYENLFHSAESRAEADWLVGLNVTRALTCKYNAQLSAGRVQTPTLALIVAREKEIRDFKPREFWRLKADLGKFTVRWDNGKGSGAIYDQKTAEELKRAIINGAFTVTEVGETAKSVPPPLLYDLTELQRDANKAYHFSPKQTLDIMQRLYETHKVLTYPRTDSRHLSDDIVPTLPERLKAVAFAEFTAAVKEIGKEGRAIAKSCINNQKVSDHHAIIPTEERPNLLKMTAEEKKIYFMVVKRFLAAFYPPYQYKTVGIRCSWQQELFRADGKTETAKGWRLVYDLDKEEEEEEYQNLPPIKKGDSFICKNTLLKADQTKPPSRYTEASLLAAMENPSKLIADKKMKEYIGGGLGTPATRADIIEKLYRAFYMENRDNVIHPTSKAIQLMELVPTELKEPLLTAKWERELEAIAKGQRDKKSFIGEIRGYTQDLVKTVKNSAAVYHPDNLTRTPCPQCGKMMLEVNGKRGKLLVCQDRECGYKKNISMKTNVRCPECHKVMDLYGEGEKRTYICACGFREKAESFHKKRGERGSSKREVQKYLHEQERQQGEEELSPLAKALREAMKNK
ncbi:MAG TPA: DNA topoisomerase III [Clostridiales bacterium]|nr:DNA topoisomerase III [Clostridiales bacterium]